MHKISYSIMGHTLFLTDSQNFNSLKFLSYNHCTCIHTHLIHTSCVCVCLTLLPITGEGVLADSEAVTAAGGARPRRAALVEGMRDWGRTSGITSPLWANEVNFRA